jgi:hypothetical protein
MAAEPICIYSRSVDLRGVAALLRKSAPDVRVEGPDDCWSAIHISGKSSVTFTYHAALCDSPGPEWGRHKFGLMNYLRRFSGSESVPDLFRLVDSFAIVLGTLWDPDRADQADDDEREKYLFEVAQHLDGILFTPSSLFDSKGRLLLAADGETDPDATMPKLPPREPASSVEEDLPEPMPPTPERVARRALALAAVAQRALLESDWLWWSRGKRHREILVWVADIDIGDELEPDEWSVLQRPPGRLQPQDHINSMWRLEGLVVLAWALGRYDMPPQDALVNPKKLLKAIGLADADRARELLASPTLRSAEELAKMSKILLAIHWRLREFSLRPQKVDLRKFAKEGWMCPFDISPIALVEDDLAIEHFTISKALAESVSRTHSSAMERHLAIRWLAGDSPIYSRTDTST